MLPGVVRLAGRMVRDRLRGAQPVWRQGLRAAPEMGVPLGGLGGGSITRGWRGHFVRWQLRPGLHEYRTVAADQFSLWVRRKGAAGPDVEADGTGRAAGDADGTRALVLAPRPDGVSGGGGWRGWAVGAGRAALPGRAVDTGLWAWNWALDETKATYHALFPRAWTVYEEPVPGLRLTCRQVSPVIPHDYRDSSLPVAAFVWTVENAGPTEAEVALMFSFQNGTGGPNDLAGGHRNRLFREPAGGREVLGVCLEHRHRQAKVPRPGEGRKDRVVYEDPLTFAVAAVAGDGVEVTARPRFTVCTRRPDGSFTALDLWREFAAHGRLGGGRSADREAEGEAEGRAEREAEGEVKGGGETGPSRPGEAIGAAVCARTVVPPGEACEVVFVLAWDMPVARFGLGTGWYRRYTRFYGRDGKAAAALARDAVLRLAEWEAAIEAWQGPVLGDPGLPDWYKSLLFNETYYLVDGGTVWTAGRPETGGGPAAEFLPEPDIGHFAYLESHEYLMYNTYDVHFSASFALAMLWPELELSLQRDFARAVGLEHPETVTYLFSGRRAPRKVAGVVPHDLGSPSEDPWRLVNAYDAQDVSRWKDLNPKFVLQVHRDWVLSGDGAFLADVWPAVEKAVDYMLRFDRDGDGLIENEGYPDQTYDVWSARGPSAYTGGLWLACLEAGAALARATGREEKAAEWEGLLARAREAYEESLWNGEYYLYDASGGPHSDSVMADQLAGHWFTRASGLPGVVPSEHARSVLRKVFALNVMGWRGGGRGRRGDPPAGAPGERGAVNGMRPDGRPDRTCMQSAEVWTGTTFSLAAAMLQEGMREEAFATARGVYLSVYRDFPLWFQTPEAIDVDGVYRAIGYMRPLAVWAMQWELEARGEQARTRPAAGNR